jgi:hypothetical protein
MKELYIYIYVYIYLYIYIHNLYSKNMTDTKKVETTTTNTSTSNSTVTNVDLLLMELSKSNNNNNNNKDYTNKLCPDIGSYPGSSTITVVHNNNSSDSDSGSGSDSDGDGDLDSGNVSKKLLHINPNSSTGGTTAVSDSDSDHTKSTIFSTNILTHIPGDMKDSAKNTNRCFVCCHIYIQVFLVVLVLTGGYLYHTTAGGLSYLIEKQKAGVLYTTTVSGGVQVLSHEFDSVDTFGILKQRAVMPRYLLIEYSNPILHSNSSYLSHRMSLYINTVYATPSGLVMLACSDGSLVFVTREEGIPSSQSSTVVVVTPPGYPYVLHRGINETSTIQAILHKWVDQLLYIVPSTLNYDLYDRFGNMTVLLKDYHQVHTKKSLYLTRNQLLYYSD